MSVSADTDSGTVASDSEHCTALHLLCAACCRAGLPVTCSELHSWLAAQLTGRADARGDGDDGDC